MVVDVPKDVQNWVGTYRGEGLLPVPGYRHRIQKTQENTMSEEHCEEFFAFLNNCERPLVYAGGGVINANAAEAVRTFALTYKIPVTTTLMGLGGFDTMHPLAMHMLGFHGTAYANYAVDDCDLLIALGGRFDDRVAGDPPKFARNAKHILHFDIDPSEIHKVKPANWHHVGLLKPALEALIAHGRRTGFAKDYSKWHAELQELKKTYALNYDRESDLIQPNYVIETINQITRGEAIISTGVGQHQMWAAQYFDFREPRLWMTLSLIHI